MQQLQLDRVADDYTLATALGMDPGAFRYSETDDCSTRHIAKLARQELKDLEKKVNQHAKAAIYYRKEAEKQIEDLQKKTVYLYEQLDECK